MRKIVNDPKLPNAQRIESLQVLTSIKAPGAEKICFEIIDAKSSEELRREAIRGLSAVPSLDAAGGLIGRWKSFDVAARVDALDVLCSRADFASALLDACANNFIARSDIGSAAVRRMRTLNDVALNKKIESAWGRVRDKAPAELKAQIEKYRGIVNGGAGDAKAGAKVFEKTCLPCHTIFNKGNHVGPELTGSGRKDLNYLLKSYRRPHAVVARPYYVWTIRKRTASFWLRHHRRTGRQNRHVEMKRTSARSCSADDIDKIAEQRNR